MWRTISWVVILIIIIIGHNVIGHEVQVFTIDPETEHDKTKFIDEYNERVVKMTSPTICDEDGSEEEKTEAGVIVTKHGPVRGYEMEQSKIWKFLDIPYATFDIKYPFQESRRPESWETIREITEHRSHCPQLDSEDSYTGNADCLTLSVFMPQEAKHADVLFHIHDGNFIRGSGDPRIYGPELLVNNRNIILVLPNYRLGPLGFLCMRNDVAPGNAGLKDLTMALNWTRENIEAFGGNPLNIVVSGTGTAAALTQYLALAPKSKLYVSKVITESGCVLSHWAIDRTPIDTAKNMIQRLNNSEKNDAKHTDVFNYTSIKEIIIAAKGLFFRPCVDKEFLTETPWSLLRGRKFNASFMLGASDRPGLQMAMQYTEESVSELNKDFRLFLPNDLAFEQHEDKKETGRRVKTQYFGNKTITLEHRNELSLCHSDCSYLSPGIRIARLLVAAEGTVYLYEFSFVNNTRDTETNEIKGAAQGDSLKYVFQREKYGPAKDTEEYRIINIMTNLWASFIQTGIPTSQNIEWEKLKIANESEETWLLIDTKPQMMKGYHQERLNLWTEIYDEHFIEHTSGNQTQTYFSVCLFLLVYFANTLCS